MNVSLNSLSIKSSLLGDDLLKERRKNEKFAILLGVVAQFIWAINSIQLKTYSIFFPKDYSNNSIVFLRSTGICVIGYIIITKKGIPIPKISEMKYRFWFLACTAGNYFSIFLWVVFISYFRVATCQCINGCTPVFILILSVIILKEKFYVRYLFGILFCFAGTTLMVLNEKDGASQSDKTTSKSVFVGCLIGVMVVGVNSFYFFGQKVVCKKVENHVINFYLGLFNALPALACMILQWDFRLSNPIYVLYGLSNGAVFYTANCIQVIAFEYIAMSKFIPVQYMLIVFIFLLGFLILREQVFITDVIGSLIIMSFQIYNVMVPLK